MERLPKLWSDALPSVRRHILFIILMMIGMTPYPVRAAGESQPLPGPGAPPEQTLHITSDKLTSDRNTFDIIFSGNVHAVYGQTTILSDTLKVTYLGDSGSQTRLNEDKIDNIVASGHVTIQFDNKTAHCDEAVYTNKTKTVLLTGKDVRVQSDDSYIDGEKITIYQDTGQIVVEGNPEKRVNAVFKPQKGSTDIFGKQKNDEPK